MDAGMTEAIPADEVVVWGAFLGAAADAPSIAADEDAPAPADAAANEAGAAADALTAMDAGAIAGSSPSAGMDDVVHDST